VNISLRTAILHNRIVGCFRHYTTTFYVFCSSSYLGATRGFWFIHGLRLSTPPLLSPVYKCLVLCLQRCELLSWVICFIFPFLGIVKKAFTFEVSSEWQHCFSSHPQFITELVIVWGYCLALLHNCLLLF